ncbi:hypothetical protein [Halobellus rufus]|uniref:hypothetical protein n=1 Tax=Halobellus rufus TaxID=1448860 RepID=UPI0012E019EA|nr:hypothetical protein [Halobellus rufus]
MSQHFDTGVETSDPQAGVVLLWADAIQALILTPVSQTGRITAAEAGLSFEQFAPEELVYAYRFQRERSGGRFSCKRMLRSWGLLPEQTIQYEAEWSDEYACVFVDLEAPIETA